MAGLEDGVSGIRLGAVPARGRLFAMAVLQTAIIYTVSAVYTLWIFVGFMVRI